MKSKLMRCDTTFIKIHKEIAKDRIKNDIDTEKVLSFRLFTKGIGSLIKKDDEIRNRLILAEIKDDRRLK